MVSFYASPFGMKAFVFELRYFYNLGQSDAQSCVTGLTLTNYTYACLTKCDGEEGLTLIPTRTHISDFFSLKPTVSSSACFLVKVCAVKQ